MTDDSQARWDANIEARADAISAAIAEAADIACALLRTQRTAGLRCATIPRDALAKEIANAAIIRCERLSALMNREAYDRPDPADPSDTDAYRLYARALERFCRNQLNADVTAAHRSPYTRGIGSR